MVYPVSPTSKPADQPGRTPPAPKKTTTKRNIFGGLKIAAMATAGLISALALWEGILQMTVESRRGAETHPFLGRVEKPGRRLSTLEGFSHTQLNSLGMRAPEPTAKLPGEYRILMLGDSYTRADEVNDGLSFSDRLQTALNAQISPNKTLLSQRSLASSDTASTIETVQVINAGKPSASPAGYLYAADFHQNTFAPDSTVIQLTEHDFTLDMSDSFSEFYLEKTTGGKSGTDRADTQASEPAANPANYQVRRNEQFGSADPLAQIITQKAPQLSALMQLSVLRVGGRNLHGMLFPDKSEAGDYATSEDISLEEQQRIQTQDAEMVNWTIQQLKQTFPNVVLVFLPAMNYQDADVISSDPRNAAIEQAIEAAAAAEDVPLLNMRSDFLAHYRNQKTHLRGFNNTLPGEGHLNEMGHRLVAERLEAFYSQPDSPLAALK